VLFYLWLVGKTIKISSLAGPGNYEVQEVVVDRSLDDEFLTITLKRKIK